tara:strand:- start:1493 stop:1915 length:423 start_codon:yes stop_codon:yes gene_type:complete
MDKLFSKKDNKFQIPTELYNQTAISSFTNSSELTDLSQDDYAIMKMNEQFLLDIIETINLSKEILTKDTTNYDNTDKENLIKIHKSINSIINNLSNELEKIDKMKLYDLNYNVRDNLNKLKENLFKLNDMCNNIYKKYEC